MSHFTIRKRKKLQPVAEPRDCFTCLGHGYIRIDTAQANPPHWKAGEDITADCPRCGGTGIERRRRN
jgi:DnaJ-class molecular chaperone